MNKAIDAVKSLDELKNVQDEYEVLRLTEQYFEHMEAEKALHFKLTDLLLNHIDSLLGHRTISAWQEIVLLVKEKECRILGNVFWQFYLLEKVAAIYEEELLIFHEGGEEPSTVQLGSFEELSETYFRLLLLLRRLNYNVVPEKEEDIIDYIKVKGVSSVFIKHVIEHNQIENKKKVRERLEELLHRYE